MVIWLLLHSKVTNEQYVVKGSVLVKNKKYVLEFQYQDKVFLEELCPVKKEATMFINTIAEWQMEKLISEMEMEKIYELCTKEKR